MESSIIAAYRLRPLALQASDQVAEGRGRVHPRVFREKVQREREVVNMYVKAAVPDCFEANTKCGSETKTERPERNSPSSPSSLTAWPSPWTGR